LAEANEINKKDLSLDIYFNLCTLYSEKEDFKQAFRYHQLYSQLKDEIFNEKKSKQIAEMRVKFESEKKEKENIILQKNLTIRELELNRQKNLRNFIIILLGISLLMVWVVTNRYQAKKRAHRLLAERNQVISKQKEELNQTLKNLRKSEQKIRAIFDNAGAGLGKVNRDGQCIRVNTKWADMLGLPQEKILNKNFLDFFHPDDNITAKEYFQSLVNGEINAFQLEIRYLHKDGSFFWGDLCATPIVSPGGDTESVIFMVIDISDRKEAEFSLRESEEKYRNLVEKASFGIAIVQDNKIKFVNSQFTKLSGYSPGELIDTPLENYIKPPPVNIDQSKEQVKFATLLSPKIGQKIDVEVSTGEIYYGTRFADLLFIHDITEKKLLEKERLKIREFESMGTLMANLAEYFDNIFTKFTRSLDFINTSEEEPGDKNQKLVLAVANTSRKIMELSKSFLLLSKEKLDIRELRLQEKIKEWVPKTDVTADLTVELNIPVDVWTIGGNSNQIKIVITELLENSITTRGSDWVLKVAAENLEVKEDYADLSQGRYVKLTMALTLKNKRIRTQTTTEFGLSFALIYTIVKKHNGVIRMQPGMNRRGSAVFEIYLPAYKAF
jgi:PAS domain S-box-containing protein